MSPAGAQGQAYREKTRAPKTQAEKQRELAEAKEQAKAKVAAACKATADKSVASCGHALESQASRARRMRGARARAVSSAVPSTAWRQQHAPSSGS